MTVPAATAAIIESAPAERAGVASAVFNVSRQIGNAIGVALFGTLAVAAPILSDGLHLSAVIAAVSFLCRSVLAFLAGRTAPDHLLIVLSQANCATRVLSRNQRRIADRVRARAQRPAIGSGAAAPSFAVQQAGQEQHRLVAHRQRGGICDTHQDTGPAVPGKHPIVQPVQQNVDELRCAALFVELGR